MKNKKTIHPIQVRGNSQKISESNGMCIFGFNNARSYFCDLIPPDNKSMIAAAYWYGTKSLAYSCDYDKIIWKKKGY